MARRPATPLKIAILRSGQEQRDIAAAIGVHPATLSRIVNGLHCDQPTREAIAGALGRPASDLFPPEPDLAS